MKLFADISEEVEYVVESKESGKDHYIVGRFIVGEEKNKNGRLYKMEILEPEMERYIREMVKTGRALGECGHPSGPQVHLDRVSHRITELTKNGNAFDGKALITNTPMGNVVKGLLESGAKIGASTRGMGSLKEQDGAMYVQKDFKLSAVDVVSDPSAPNAWVSGILEGIEYFYDDIRGTWKEEKIEEMAKKAKQLSKEEREAKALALFEAYFQLLVNS